MALDDLIKSVEMFKQGVSEYQTTQAVADARQSLSQATLNAKNEDERFKQAQGIGQDLALRLTAANVSPERIQSAIGGLVPSASVTEQGKQNIAGEQVKMSSTEGGSPFGLEKTKSETAIAIAKMHLDAALGKNATKEANDMNKYVTDFSKQPQNKPIFDSINKLDEALGSLNQNQGKMGATMATEMAKLGVIRSVAGRVNVQEIQAANESPSLRAKLWKEAGLQTTGEVPKNVQEFWTNYITGLKGKAQERLKAAAEGHVAGANPNWDKAALTRMTQARYATHLGTTPATDTQNASVMEALDWLSSPEAQGATPAMRKAVMDKIKAMQGKK